MEFRSPTKLDTFDRAFLLLAIALAGIHLYLGLFVGGARAPQFVIIGSALLLGPFVFFTSYWRPLLYLLGSALAVYLGTLWVLGGMEYFLIGVLTGIIATSFVLLGFYLFVREQSRFTRFE